MRDRGGHPGAVDGVGTADPFTEDDEAVREAAVLVVTLDGGGEFVAADAVGGFCLRDGAPGIRRSYLPGEDAKSRLLGGRMVLFPVSVEGHDPEAVFLGDQGHAAGAVRPGANQGYLIRWHRAWPHPVVAGRAGGQEP